MTIYDLTKQCQKSLKRIIIRVRPHIDISSKYKTIVITLVALIMMIHIVQF